MAKKTKDTTAAAAKKEAKAKAPVDPLKTRNLIRLLNILALLLAVTAFLLQLFAVLTHHWKWQITSLRPLVNPYDRQAQSSAYDDSRLDQNYGLFSRDVKLFAHNDEQVSALASTRFPRLDDGDANFHTCLSQTSTLRGALLTCSARLASPDECHCRRYPHWNAVIFFEILALVLLGLLVFICALLNTQYHALLKPVGLAVAFLAFLSLLLGLIILLSYLKRETRSIADIYPHTSHRFAQKVGLVADPSYPVQVQRVVRRQTQETFRAYSLLPGQYPYNNTHYQEYSNEVNAWVQKPYTSKNTAAYVPRNQQSRPVAASRATTEGPLYNNYGPLVGYDRVYEHTRAGPGWSTVLSILALILSLLLPAILALSWLSGKKLGSEVQTVTTTTVKTEYVAVPHDVTVETVPLTRAIPSDYDAHRPVGEAVVTTHNVRAGPYDNYSGRPEVAHGRDEQATVAQTYRP